MKFGSHQWHVFHNMELAKSAARIYMAEYRRSRKHFYLAFAIDKTCEALKLKQQIRGFV
jgi:hypothetical protein